MDGVLRGEPFRANTVLQWRLPTTRVTHPRRTIQYVLRHDAKAGRSSPFPRRGELLAQDGDSTLGNIAEELLKDDSELGVYVFQFSSIPWVRAEGMESPFLRGNWAFGHYIGKSR